MPRRQVGILIQGIPKNLIFMCRQEIAQHGNLEIYCWSMGLGIWFGYCFEFKLKQNGFFQSWFFDNDFLQLIKSYKVIVIVNHERNSENGQATRLSASRQVDTNTLIYINVQIWLNSAFCNLSLRGESFKSKVEQFDLYLSEAWK